MSTTEERQKKRKMKRYAAYAVRYIGIPILLELIIESLGRKSFFGGFTYLVKWPSLFVFNTLIIMLTVSIALFFKREIFVYTTIIAAWLGFGIVNFIILHFRVTPFSAVDFRLIESAFSVSGHYLNAFNVTMIILGIVLVVAALIALFFMAPKYTHRTQKRILVSLLCVGLIVSALAFIHTNSNSVKALEKNYTNIAEAYENYGFVYCFTNSIIDTGIDKPEDYDEKHVQDILSTLPVGELNPPVKPNIIFIQLESFFDVDTLKKLKLSADPIPNFHKLQESYSKGLVTVPTVGAGTVNTEFEILTAMSQKDFGTSEYPYKTVLRDKTVESICYDLKKLGYRTHCVHNNEGTFYGRNKVYKNLGFDTFTSMEFMNGLEDNPNGWKKDRVLTGEILSVLDSTPGTDFTMGITVQSHGKYKGFENDEARVKVEQAPDPKKVSDYEYYVNQLYEVDQMIGDLVTALEKRNEKTVLVFYGDHLPSLDIEKKDLQDSNLYQTQYVVWDNLGLAKTELNLTSYQMYPEILKRLGINTGLFTKYQQSASWRTKSYHENLKMLEYDFLYGEKYAYQGTNPYEPVETQMGTHPVTILDVVKNDKGYLVTGTGFTPYCHLLFGGEEVAIQWIDSTHIQALEEVTVDETAATPEPSASPEPKKDDIPNVFFIQVCSEGGTVLAESQVKPFAETTVGKTVPAPSQTPVPAVTGQ